MRNCWNCGHEIPAFRYAEYRDITICVLCRAVHYEGPGGTLVKAPKYETVASDVAVALRGLALAMGADT